MSRLLPALLLLHGLSSACATTDEAPPCDRDEDCEVGACRAGACFYFSTPLEEPDDPLAVADAGPADSGEDASSR